MTALSIRNVDVVFGSFQAVRNVSFDVKRGEIFVIMGTSGSGKSTLLRLVNQLLRPTRGDVVLFSPNAVHVNRLTSSALRLLRQTQVSMVFQQFSLLPWRSVAENIALGLELRGIKRAERMKRVETYVEQVGLSDWKDKLPAQLSGGMQQRVGLARALATDAPMLLMDEPFSALDPIIRRHLQKEILDIKRRLNKTILFVTHDIDEALAIGDRVAIMDKGEILQIGTPHEIVHHPQHEFVEEFVSQKHRQSPVQ